MPSEFTRVNQATELAIGRNPEVNWYIRTTGGAQSDHLYGPEANTSNRGVALGNTVSCNLHVSPTLKAEGITVLAQVKPIDFDATTAYTLEVPNGTPYAATEATLQALIDQLVQDINLAAADPIGPYAVAVDLDEDGISDTVLVWTYGDPTVPTAPTLTADFSEAGGSGSWTGVTIDAEDVSIKPWLKLKDQRGGIPLTIPWAQPRGETWPVTVTDQGYTTRLNVAGYDRLYVEEDAITERAGNGATVGVHYCLVVAPAIREE